METSSCTSMPSEPAFESKILANTEGEAKCGRHSQSTDPSFEIRAPEAPFPIIP